MSVPLLLVGGTGLVGAAVLRETSKRPDYNVLILSRSASSQNNLARVQYIQGSALDTSSLKPVLQDNPNVIHTVGVLIEDRKRGKDGTYMRLNHDAAISVANAMVERYDGKERRCLVVFSAATPPPRWLLDEKYASTKYKADTTLLTPAYQDKIRVVIFRPGLICSYHRRQLLLPLGLGLLLGSMILKPLSSYVPDDLKYFTDRPLLDNTIAQATLEAVENPEVEGLCDIDRIRALAKAWEKRQLLENKLS